MTTPHPSALAPEDLERLTGYKQQAQEAQHRKDQDAHQARISAARPSASSPSDSR